MSHHILYVQNDDRMAAAVERILLDEGYECDRARLGNEAVTLARRNRYGLILLHVKLPDMDGYELVRRIREAKVHTPFLIQRGHSAQARDGNRCGPKADDYLAGPFNRHTLIERINAVFHRVESPPDRAADTPGKLQTGKRLSRPLSGLIVFDDRRTPVDCAIIGASAGGGALRVDGPNADYPDHFVLTVPGDKGYRCQVSWRSGDEIGVEFI